MAIKITNKQIPVHIDYFDFMPRWSLEKAEYEKAKITSVVDNHKAKSKGDLAEPDSHWFRFPTTEEIVYYEFMDKISDKGKFYPARDEDRRPIPKTGAMKVTTDILRLKTRDNEEFLLTKSYIIGHSAKGQEVSHYLPFSEKWIKTLFSWTDDYNKSRESFDKICLGPSGTETIYLLEFNKDNALELFKQRASDLVNFIVKDEISDEARRVEPDVNALKTFERFANNSFEFLWTADYLPPMVKAELRTEAHARGWIKGSTSDFNPPTEPPKRDAGVR